jgi:hypothetical protein
VLVVVNAGRRVLLLVQEGQAQIADGQGYEVRVEHVGARCERLGQPPADGGAKRAGPGAADHHEDAKPFRCHGNESTR